MKMPLSGRRGQSHTSLNLDDPLGQTQIPLESLAEESYGLMLSYIHADIHKPRLDHAGGGRFDEEGALNSLTGIYFK